MSRTHIIQEFPSASDGWEEVTVKYDSGLGLGGIKFNGVINQS